MVDVASLIEDRPEAGVFRVHRDAYTSPEVFELEMARVFEGTWVFIGLESQLRRPHDFFTTFIGRQPVLVMRDEDGRIGAFLNSCRHRGTLLTPFASGNQRVHMCRYHAWTYDSAGRGRVAGEREGQYPPSFAGGNHDLVPVKRLGSYRGLLFASLSDGVPPLEEHLGDARLFLDLVLDQAEHGMESVPGSIAYTFEGNWKLQFENGIDPYHFNATHASYIEVVRQRGLNQRTEAGRHWIDDPTMPEQGYFGFPRGHVVVWSNVNAQRLKRPLMHDPQAFARIAARVGPERARWMQINRNMTIYPNLQVLDVYSLQLRAWRPLAVDRTEMSSWCLAPIGEDPAVRRRRLRQYEDFFNPSGMATPDDNVMYEYAQSGLMAAAAGETQGHLRGLGGSPAAALELARRMGVQPAGAASGGFSLGIECSMHEGYREWRRLLTAPAAASV